MSVLPGYLLRSVQCGDAKKVNNWLLRGGSVDARWTDHTGYTLLHAAVAYEKGQLVSELIHMRATVDLRSDEGSTALMIASEQNSRGCSTVRLLLKHAANPNLMQQDGITALMSATRNRRDEIVTALLEHSAHPDHQRQKRGAGTALVVAAAEGRSLLAAQQESLSARDRVAEAQWAKDQSDADAMMEQLMAEESEEKQAKGEAASTKNAKAKRARKKRGKPAGTDQELEARDAGAEAAVEDGVKGQAALVTNSTVAPFIGAKAAAPVPVATGGAAPARSVGASRGRGGCSGRGLSGRGPSCRGGHQMQSAVAAVGALAHLMGQASIHVPPPLPPAAVTSLADTQFHTGRPEAPESTIGGQTTCIVCFINPKSHAAVPCGHLCACGDCSVKMMKCPVCRNPAAMWMHVRVA